MRTSVLLVLVMALGAAPTLAAEPAAEAPARPPGLRPGGGDLGLGASLGWPTGFTGKWWFADQHGVAFGAGIGGFSWVGGHVDYQWTPTLLYQSDDIAVAPYLGFGAFGGLFPTIYTPFARAASAVVFALGVEVPMGVAINVGAYPLDIFVELAPGLSVLPNLGVGSRAMAGARWYL